MIVAVGLAACAIVVFASTWREAEQRRERSGRVFDTCADVFSDGVRTIAPDGFARLTGRLGHQRYILSLIPDSLTIKRLPQLWLSISMPIRSDQMRIAVTARPRSDDFFSSASRLTYRGDVPDWLPHDVAIRSESPTAQTWIDEHRDLLREAFGDPLLKEIAVSPSGVRLIYRLAEGDRGRHLLLRQSSFDAELTPALFLKLHALLTSFCPARHHDLEEAA